LAIATTTMERSLRPHAVAISVHVRLADSSCALGPSSYQAVPRHALPAIFTIWSVRLCLHPEPGLPWFTSLLAMPIQGVLQLVDKERHNRVLVRNISLHLLEWFSANGVHTHPARATWPMLRSRLHRRNRPRCSDWACLDTVITSYCTYHCLTHNAMRTVVL